MNTPATCGGPPCADERTLTFEVKDDGVGFDPATMRQGAGVTTMTDRADALGGTLEVVSDPGAGTRVSGVRPATARVAAPA